MQVSVTRGWTALSATRTTARFSVRPATAGDWALKVTGLVRGPGLSARTVRTLESSESRHSRQAKFDVSCRNGEATSVREGRGRGLEAPQGQGCPACNCYVYHADQVRGETNLHHLHLYNPMLLLQIFSKGRVWHKECFKCSRCSRFLDSRIACDGSDNKLYCNGCPAPDY